MIKTKGTRKKILPGVYERKANPEKKLTKIRYKSLCFLNHTIRNKIAINSKNNKKVASKEKRAKLKYQRLDIKIRDKEKGINDETDSPIIGIFLKKKAFLK